MSSDRGQDNMLKQWISSQTWPDILRKWSDIQHNWLEIVYCPVVISVYDVWTSLLLSIIYTVFWAYHLYFKHDVSAWSLYSKHDVSAQSLYILNMMFQHFEYSISLVMFCILRHSTVYLSFLNTVLLWHDIAQFGILLSTPVNQAIKTIRREG